MQATTRPRGLSLRWKLTLSYAALVVIAGVVLLAVGFLLLRFVPQGNLTGPGGGFVPNRSDLETVFVRYAVIGLSLLAILGLGGGWLLAGRMLTRLTAITRAAQRVRGGDLDHRIAMPGRSDELSQLADTVDDMVSRIQTSVGEHRRFAANASHELRTPQSVIRTMLEVARADPDRDVEKLLDRVEAMNERSIVLSESLLALANAENGLPDVRTVDLATLVAAHVEELSASAHATQISVVSRLERAEVRGDPVLLSQLISNLLRNALSYNHAAGEIVVTTRTSGADAVLEVANTGPVITQQVAATLTEPFVRGATRARSQDQADAGAGLGLAIAASVVRAHGGIVELSPRPEGGLIVGVRLPAAV